MHGVHVAAVGQPACRCLCNKQLVKLRRFSTTISSIEVALVASKLGHHVLRQTVLDCCNQQPRLLPGATQIAGPSMKPCNCQAGCTVTRFCLLVMLQRQLLGLLMLAPDISPGKKRLQLAAASQDSSHLQDQGLLALHFCSCRCMVAGGCRHIDAGPEQGSLL